MTFATDPTAPGAWLFDRKPTTLWNATLWSQADLALEYDLLIASGPRSGTWLYDRKPTTLWNVTLWSQADHGLEHDLLIASGPRSGTWLYDRKPTTLWNVTFWSQTDLALEYDFWLARDITPICHNMSLPLSMSRYLLGNLGHYVPLNFNSGDVQRVFDTVPAFVLKPNWRYCIKKNLSDEII